MPPVSQVYGGGATARQLTRINGPIAPDRELTREPTPHPVGVGTAPINKGGSHVIPRERIEHDHPRLHSSPPNCSKHSNRCPASPLLDSQTSEISYKLSIVNPVSGSGERPEGKEQRNSVMSSEIIFEVTESPEGGYQARALGYSIFTQAETHDELKAMVKDAVRCHFEDSQDRPKLIRLHVVRDEVIPA